MSFREKSAWVCLLAILATQGPYFIHVLRLFGQGPVATWQLMPALAGAIVAQTVLNIAALVVLGRRARSEPKDERDQAIEAAAYRRAYRLLNVAMVAMLFVAFRFDSTITVVQIGQMVWAGWVLAELAKYASLAWDHRRGIAGLSVSDA